LSWYDFMENPRTCPTCAWTGPGSETTMGDAFHDGSERHCPKCGHYFGYWVYPLISESLTDPRAPGEDCLFAEVVMERVAEIHAAEAIAKAARGGPPKQLLLRFS